MEATRVLVADDSKLITKQIVKALLTNKISGHNFEEEYIYLAYDGMHAFEVLGKHPEISLLISDINMPELNGDELIEVLIDTKKLTSLDVVFVTTESMALGISPTTAKYTLGTIYKPFNINSFTEDFNKLLSLKEQKNEALSDIKASLKEEKEVLLLWIKSYCEKFTISYDEKIVIPIVDVELDLDSSISKDELFSLFGVCMEHYLFTIKSNHVVDAHNLKEIYVEWENPDDFKTVESPLEIKENIIEMMNQTQTHLDAGRSVDDIETKFTESMNLLIEEIQAKCHTKKMFPYNDFVPYIYSAINFLLKIDPHFQKKRLDVLLCRIEEIRSVNEWLKSAISKKAFSDETLQCSSALFDALDETLKTLMLNLEERMQNFIYELELTLWHKAEQSVKIAHYIKKHLRNKVPNTHNLFLRLGKIDEYEMQEYEKYQKENVYIISSDLDLLKLFQESLAPKLPLWEFSYFTKATQVMLKVSKHLPTKFIIDLNYKDDIVKNGLVLINTLKKKYPGINTMIDNGGLIFMMMPSQAELLHQKAQDLKYRMLLKPLSEKKLFAAMMHVHTQM